MAEAVMRAEMRSTAILRLAALGLLLGSQCTQAVKARTTAHASARARKNGVEALELLPIALSQADTSASDTVAANAAVNALTLKESSNSQVDLSNLTDSIQTLFGLSGQVVPVAALTVTTGQPTSQPAFATTKVPSGSPTKHLGSAAAVTSAATAGSNSKTPVSKVVSKSSSLRLPLITTAAAAARVREQAPTPSAVPQVHDKVPQDKQQAKATDTRTARALPSPASTVSHLPSTRVQQSSPVAVSSTASAAELATLKAKLVKNKPLPAATPAGQSPSAAAPSSTSMPAPAKVTSRAAVHTPSVPRAHPTIAAVPTGRRPATTTAPLRAVATLATSTVPEVFPSTNQVPSAPVAHSTTAAAPVDMWRVPETALPAAPRRSMPTSTLHAVPAVADQVADQVRQTALPVKPAAITTTVLHTTAITADNLVDSGPSTEKSSKSPSFGSWLFTALFGSSGSSPAAAVVSKSVPQRPKFTKQDIEATASKARREFLMDVAISDGFSRLEHEDEGHVQHVRHEDEALRVAAETPQLGAIAPPLAEDADAVPPSSAASGFWGSLASEDGQIEHAVEENNGDNLREYARLTEMQDNRVASMMSELEDPEPALPASRLRASAERSNAR